MADVVFSSVADVGVANVCPPCSAYMDTNGSLVFEPNNEFQPFIFHRIPIELIYKTLSVTFTYQSKMEWNKT